MPPADKDNKNPVCEACDQAKLPELPRNKDSTHTASKRGYALHIDMSPKHPPTLIDRHIRIVQFIDEYSTYVMIEPCRSKTEAYEVITSKVLEVESQIAPLKVSRIRSDGAGELVKSKKLMKWYKDRGIRYQHSGPYQQHQNGLIERMVRTINEGAVEIYFDLYSLSLISILK